MERILEYIYKYWKTEDQGIAGRSAIRDAASLHAAAWRGSIGFAVAGMGCFRERTGRNADIQLFMGRVVSGSALGANLSRPFTSSQGHLQ